MAFKQMQEDTKTAEDLKVKAQALAQLLRDAQPYREFMDAHRSMQVDETFQSLSQQIEALQAQAEAQKDNQKELIRQMDALINQLESLPVVRHYYESEGVLCGFLAELDRIISREAGIPFSINARRTRCSCNS